MNVKAVSIAAAITAGVASIVCTLAFALAPNAAAGIGSALFHGIAVEAKPISASNAIAGFAAAVIGAAVIAAVFAALHNKLAGK